MNSVHYLYPSARDVNPRIFQDLLEEINAKSGRPEDPYEVSAILESMGWTDKTVQERFKLPGTFTLGEQIYHALEEWPGRPLPAKAKRKRLAAGFEGMRSFLRGLIFSLPMAISVFSMLFLKFSLWSYEYLSIDLATVIATGTILSFVVVGGFTQAIARRGFFYIYQGYYRMARTSTFFFIRMGYMLSILVAVLLFLLNIIFNIYPLDLFTVMLLYFFFLNLIWLSVTVMYILRKEILFTGLIILGIAIVYLLFIQLKQDIILSQLIAIGVVAIIGLLFISPLFDREEKRKEKGIAPAKSRLSVTVFSIQPYFYYGFLYFLFLFIDRIMAWSAVDVYHPESAYMPYFIWFRGEYELGLDFALLSLMLPLGSNEVMVDRLMKWIEQALKTFSILHIKEMKDLLWRKYIRIMIVTLFISFLSALMIFFLLLLSDWLMVFFFGRNLIANPVTYFVFVIAVLSYVILSVALLNAVILFAVAQPDKVNRAIIPGLFLNLILGFLLSRWISYEYAVFGLLAGSLFFLILSFIKVRELFRRLDFYLYATL